MRLLLDTQVALWALTDSRRLTVSTRALILDHGNDVYFSAASIWEISIKRALARKEMPVSGTEALELLKEAGFIELPVTAVHAAAVEALPFHHADPFDRILVAQAQTVPLRLLTHDRLLPKYGDFVQFV